LVTLSDLKLLHFPDKTTDERMTQILKELSNMDGTNDEYYSVDSLIICLINHFAELEGNEAFMINWELRKIRLAIEEFYLYTN